jgi:hypothetical protein
MTSRSRQPICVLGGFFVGIATAQFMLPGEGMLVRAAIMAVCVGAGVATAIAVLPRLSPPQPKQ